ncbi:hypothetical protein F4679DRAFT_45384 [Xylaria curta]|nr:hypothetical protein F4679DRAFT_45384 [Xylaria curta]
MPSNKPRKLLKRAWNKLRKFPERPAVDVERRSEDSSASTASLRSSGLLPSGVQHAATAPTEVNEADEATALWMDAYDSLKQEDKDLVHTYELLLAAQSSTTYAAVEIVNLFTGCTPSMRISLMTDLARGAIAKAEQNSSRLEGIVTSAELLAVVSSGVSKLLDVYPLAAMILSGVAVVLPAIVKPIKARALITTCLKHILEQTEWYMSLSRVLLRNNWPNDNMFTQHRSSMRNALVKLYKSLLQLEMRCVCRYYNSHEILASLQEVLSLVDWDGDLRSLKEVEQDIAEKISKYNIQALVNELFRISTGQTELTTEMKRAVTNLDSIIKQHEDWRDEQMQRHRNMMREQLSALIGKFNTSPYRAHMMRNNERVEGTCQWFCNHEKFTQWLGSDSDPILVVSADPGCGKSTLAQYLIETILPHEQPGVSVCYFFFKDTPEQRMTTTALCALLHGLFDKQPELAEICKDQILKYGEKLFTDPQLLWEILTKAVAPQSSQIETTSNSSIICVLDALDECDPEELRGLLRNLDSLMVIGATKYERPRIKFLLTTRGYPGILQQINVMESRILRLAGEGKDEMDAIQEEISLVVGHRLKKLIKMKDIDMETEKIIGHAIGERGASQRTYLWVKLVFEVLEANFDDDPDEWERLIYNPPLTIFEAYEKLLQHVKPKDQEFVRLLLSLVFISRRPLSLLEMNTAIEVRNHVNANDVPRLATDKSFRSRVIDACGFFITIYDGRLFSSTKPHESFHLYVLQFLQISDGHPQ